MATYSNDIAYAYLQLGLEPGAYVEDVQRVQENAAAYRFSTKPRVNHVRRFVEFFFAWSVFGGIETPYADIRKSYRVRAMASHPDRNQGSAESEEILKALNVAYSLVESVHREAEEFFQQSEQSRHKIQGERIATRLKEEPPKYEEPQPRHRTQPPPKNETHHAEASAGVKFMAASVPRFIRNARLSYLPLRWIVGSWFIEIENDINYVFDVFMLPEAEFNRARMNLGAPGTATMSYDPGKFSPAYILKDIKQLIVPPGVEDPAAYARNYFIEAFNLVRSQKPG